MICNKHWAPSKKLCFSDHIVTKFLFRFFFFHAKALHDFFPLKEQKHEEFRSMSLIKISKIKFWNMLLFSSKYFALPIIIDYLRMVTQKLFRDLTSNFRKLSNLKELWNGQRNVESGHQCACCWYPLCVDGSDALDNLSELKSPIQIDTKKYLVKIADFITRKNPAENQLKSSRKSIKQTTAF